MTDFPSRLGSPSPVFPLAGPAVTNRLRDQLQRICASGLTAFTSPVLAEQIRRLGPESAEGELYRELKAFSASFPGNIGLLNYSFKRPLSDRLKELLLNDSFVEEAAKSEGFRQVVDLIDSLFNSDGIPKFIKTLDYQSHLNAKMLEGVQPDPSKGSFRFFIPSSSELPFKPSSDRREFEPLSPFQSSLDMYFSKDPTWVRLRTLLEKRRREEKLKKPETPLDLFLRNPKIIKELPLNDLSSLTDHPEFSFEKFENKLNEGRVPESDPNTDEKKSPKT